MNNCPKCGNPLQVGTNSCPICGTNILAAAPAPAQPAQPASTAAQPAAQPAQTQTQPTQVVKKVIVKKEVVFTV